MLNAQPRLRNPLPLLPGVLMALVLSQAAFADFVILYDGTGLPSSQAWLSFAALEGNAQQTSIPGGVRLQTDTPVKAGYSNYLLPGLIKNAAFPSLNPTVGFEMSFNLAVTTENHSSNDRAGFSAIILGNDRKGIELGFWTNEIWAQSSNPLFTRAESVVVDTRVRRDYRLQILANTYTLFDGANRLLTGATRDYTAFNAPPYTQPNFLFLGDDTSSASADITLGRVTLQTDLTAVPEPSSFALLCSAVVLFQLWSRKRSLKDDR